MEQFSGRIAVVTGAASGIGLALVEAFLDLDMLVAMADVNEPALAAEAERVGGELPDRVLAVPTDVTDPQSVERLAAAVVERFGGLHVAVNNAGIVNRGKSWELPLDEWHRVLDVNLWGEIHGVRAFVPRILATGEEGHVVNVASMAAVSAIAELGPYTVAKHGVLGLSDVLRAELDTLDPPVGVSVVMPGGVRTGMNPIGTVDPRDVAVNVIDAMRRGRPYVFTDDHSTGTVQRRLEAIVAARDDVIT
jgi:NAD(P)-dependent dehydrogenase (short-subunit alcohol dehydrogenase family)